MGHTAPHLHLFHFSPPPQFFRNTPTHAAYLEPVGYTPIIDKALLPIAFHLHGTSQLAGICGGSTVGMSTLWAQGRLQKHKTTPRLALHTFPSGKMLKLAQCQMQIIILF